MPEPPPNNVDACILLCNTVTPCVSAKLIFIRLGILAAVTMKKHSHPLTGPEQTGNMRSRSTGSTFEDRGWLRIFFGGGGPLVKKLANYSIWEETSYRGANKSLAWPISPCILFDGKNNLFDASLVIYRVLLCNTVTPCVSAKLIFIRLGILTAVTMKKPSHPLTGPEQTGNMRSIGSPFEDRGWLRTFFLGGGPLW